ncbi:MAG TPA: helix-turn-helix transcriptional regulator [Vicinamibacteria bacterium]|nr:helix-turn-helix transcriptional regulator [Vicinamibacteria bacterium]
MIDREFRPNALLAPYVKLIWVLETGDPGFFGDGHRILPDGIVEVVFHYGDPFVTRFADGREQAQPRSFAISQASRFIDIRATGSCGLISVRFFPWGAYQFFPVPVSEFADCQVPAEALWGKRCRELEDAVANATTTEERVERVERFLLEQLALHQKEDLAPAVRYLWQRRGQVRMSEMTRELGIGERQLQRRFLQNIGATPKQTARLVRFIRAYRKLCQPFESLTWAAHLSGYYDQAHFIREFKEFSGLTPRQLLSRSRVSSFEL